MTGRSWSDTYWFAFIVAAGVGFVVPEVWSLLDNDPFTDPLTTWTIERDFAEVAVALGAFLVVHFTTGGTVVSRPSESITAAAGLILGALQIIIGAVSKDGFSFTDLQDPEVTGAITILVGFVASVTTWWVARRQRDPSDDLSSGTDGTVVSP